MDKALYDIIDYKYYSRKESTISFTRLRSGKLFSDNGAVTMKYVHNLCILLIILLFINGIMPSAAES